MRLFLHDGWTSTWLFIHVGGTHVRLFLRDGGTRVWLFLHADEVGKWALTPIVAVSEPVRSPSLPPHPCYLFILTIID